MRDGIALAERNIPSVSLITEEFVPQADFVAAAAGMTAVPRVVLPHPIAGTGDANHRIVAEQYVDEILGALVGSSETSQSP